MAITYFTQDYKFIDYKPWTFNDLKTLPFRGPDKRTESESSDYFVFLGSAQTFGRFVEKSFCERYGELAGVPCINLGTGGDSPEKIFRLMDGSSKYKSLIENATHVVVQVISPKNLADEDNRYTKHPNDLWSYVGDDDNKMFWTDLLGDYYYNNSKADLLDLVADSQQKYINDLKKLLGKISGQKTLLYLHRDRDLSNQESLLDDSSLETAKSSVKDYLGTFPQMISQSLLDDITASADRLISYDYSDSLPATINKAVDVSKEDEVKDKLFMYNNLKRQFEDIKNKRGLQTETENDYYPPEEAHISIAQKLYDNIPQA